MELKTRRGFDFGTNIMDIEVPAALRIKVKTGQDFIDGALGGQGLTPSSSILFIGTPGAGKTTMMLSLCDSLSSRGNTVVFNTGEESLFQVKLVAERLRIKNGFAVGEETHVPTLLENCEDLRGKNPNKPFVLIVDSLQTMNDGKYGEGVTNGRSAERALAMITDWCKDTNSIAIVIGQVGKGGQFSGRNTLKHMVDAMLELRVSEDPELVGVRILETTKNRFGSNDSRFFLQLKKTGFRTLTKQAA